MATISQPVSVRRRICVRGIVQGVGFRPFVFNRAHRVGLRGFVLNSSSGVTIEVEGPESDIERFVSFLRNDPPTLARVEHLEIADIPVESATEFVIRDTEATDDEFVLISPDVATCAECRHDFEDPRNRRHLFPFTNCTNCGPRYSIITEIPYDRPTTTMRSFRMCPECQSEYDDPGDRRFHAQPNACPVCGPKLTLVRGGSSLGGDNAAIVREVRRALHDGQIVAIKGIGGFQLACDAESAAAVRELRKRKRRSDKPFALMARDVEAIASFSDVGDADRELLLRPEAPIVIMRRRPESRIAVEVAPGNNTLGVMLPYTPLHHLLFGESREAPPEFTALVMTSGNISEEPIVISNGEAQARLDKVADAFLIHNRDIYMRVDDSVARTFDGYERVLRRSRGYVPYPIDLGSTTLELLACGGELKNTFCLTKGQYAIVSQHVGDLENLETLEFFQETLGNLKKLFRVEPQAIAYDLHPRYLSSQLALQIPDLPKIGVQHHHAHIASCMAENHLAGSVIGVAFDGTGYGTDGQIWGGEFLVADYQEFKRLAHFKYVPLPGGDAAIRQPWRAALSYLRETFGSGALPDLPLMAAIPVKQLSVVSKMLERNLNTTLTSSSGRLFDAVAAIIGLRNEVNFEAQAAIELESVCEPDIDEHYGFDLLTGDPMQIDFRPAMKSIVDNVLASVPRGVVASRFHNTVAACVVEVSSRIAKERNLDRVCLSGGTFQNMYLLERVVSGLRAKGLRVFLHSQVPPNDGGISLGQGVIANYILQHGA